MNDLGFFSGLLLFGVLLVLGSLATLITARDHRSVGLQVTVFLCALALRFGLSIAIYQFGLVEVLKDEDGSGWLRGVDFYHAWTQQGVGVSGLLLRLTNAFKEFHHGYYYLLGVLFYLTDAPARLPAAALSGFFGALTVVFAYRVARTLFSPWVATRVGWWSCVCPSMIIWSAQTIKEPIVILLETIALYGCVQLKRSSFSPRHIALCALAIVCLIPFRFYAAYVAGAAVILTLVLPQMGKRKTSMSAAVGVAALLIPFLVLSGALAQRQVRLDRYDLHYIQSFRENAAVGSGSGVHPVSDLQAPEGLGMAAIIGGAHLLLAPFPWQLGGGSLRMLLTAPELFVWWWLFFAGVVPGLWYAIRHRFSDIQPLLFFIGGLGFLYSVMFSNVGLIYRQRAQLLPWLLIFAAVGLEQRAVRRLAARRPAMGDYLPAET